MKSIMTILATAVLTGAILFTILSLLQMGLWWPVFLVTVLSLGLVSLLTYLARMGD